MKRGIIGAILLLFFAGEALADISPTILNGKAIGDKKAALFVSVVDDAGRPVKGLSKGNLKLSVGGDEIKEFTLDPVSASQEPLSIILGVDISGSMKGKPFEETKKALSIFLDQLDKKDFVCLMSFGSDVKFIADFTNERHKIRQHIESLRATDNWTHLYEAIYDAIEKGKKSSQTTRTAVILLTDGRDEGSKVRQREDALNMASGGSIPVFTIGFGHEIDKQYLQQVADGSGGRFLFTPEADQITGLYNNVLEQLKNQYMITFDFTKAPSNYKAVLTLDYLGKPATANKDFLFNPTGGGGTIIPKKYFLGGGLLLLAVLITAIFYTRKQQKDRGNEIRRILEEVKKDIPKIMPDMKTNECELEYPGEFPTAGDYFDSKSEGTTKLASHTPNVFLKVDCLGKNIPLVYKGVEVLDELILARKDREEFKKKGVVYLWSRNKSISGPKEGRPGHIRIFVNDGERFAVEDLGSLNGTYLNGNKIKDKSPALLQDGDTIEVGKQGLRIIYRESDLGESGCNERDNEGTIVGKV